MQNQIIDYVPLMDKYPDLCLRPVTDFQNQTKIQECDYVQDLHFSGKKAFHGCFYLTAKDAKFGIYMYDEGIFRVTTSVVLPPNYDSIDFLWYRNKSLGVIVSREGKYGLYFWTYSIFTNDVLCVNAEYDSIERMQDISRLKGIKDNSVTYFDMSGHVLK